MELIHLVFAGYFLVWFCDLDYDGKYNVLLQQVGGNGHLVSVRYDNEPSFNQGHKIYVNMKVECVKEMAGEVLEGNGTRGWRPEDDWYLNRRMYICNAKQKDVEVLSE